MTPDRLLDRVLDAAAEQLDTAPAGTTITGDTITIRTRTGPDFTHRVPGVDLEALR